MSEELNIQVVKECEETAEEDGKQETAVNLAYLHKKCSTLTPKHKQATEQVKRRHKKMSI